MKVRALLVGALLWCVSFSVAFAQCGGQAASGYACGNGAASTGFASFYPLSTLFDRGIGSGQGTILNRSGTGWVATVAPTLGLNGGTGGSIALEGATSGAAMISVPAAAGSVLFQLPSTNGANLDILATDGAGHLSWIPVGTSGAVTSVGLAMPGIFAVTGSPVTSTGTLTASLNTQSANTVWAGPSSGVAADPAFRALVGADLPTPTTGSLGGVEANTAVSHQWINAINISGVPQLSQPTFSDIGGTLSPTQCPKPSASTLGCVESYVGVSHQWINSISTLGVPSSTQPSFADIAGNATLVQLPTIGNNTVLANVSGGSATPLAISQTALLDTIGAVQGDILYRNSSNWVTLGPGTSGQVLTSGGTAANPSWTTATGTGTVTSVTCGIGLAGGTITGSGTCDNYLTPDSITDCIIVPSVSAGALTVALKNKAGADPSSSAPCWVSFRNTTAATGDYTVVAVTAATSFSTGTSGSTFGASNNVPFRLWVELWNNAGTVAIGVSLQTTVSTTFPLNEAATASTTACSACTNATSAGTFYTTSALIGKAFRVFGYMDWGSGLTTAGTYASGPTLVALKTISTPLPGTPIQTASGSQSSASQTTTTSASYVSTTTVATLSPTSAVDPVVCSFYGTIQLTTGNTAGTISILRGGSLVGFGLFPFTSSGGQTNWPVANTVRDLPGTTSSTTYTVSIKSDGTHTMAFPAGSGDSGAGISCSEISG